MGHGEIYDGPSRADLSTRLSNVLCNLTLDVGFEYQDELVSSLIPIGALAFHNPKTQTPNNQRKIHGDLADLSMA
jgi:hypothetical protein